MNYYTLGKIVGAVLVVACFAGVALIVYGFISLINSTIARL